MTAEEELDSAGEPAEQALRPFAHVHAANAHLYRRVMGAFATAKRRFTIHLRPEDVLDHLTATGDDPPDQGVVVDALTKLEEWGNLRADPDTSRVTTVEDFHRARYLYQMTREGAAAEAALTAYDEALGRRGALQRVALSDIAAQLRSLLALARAAESDEAVAYLTFESLATRFDELADNAQSFMASLQRTIDLHDAEIEAFLAYKDRLIDYLEQFIKDLVSTGAEIANLIQQLDEAGVGRLLDDVAHRAGRDIAPDETEDFAEREFARQRLLWAERWAGFHDWFLNSPGHPSQSSLLRTQARAAIPRLLRVVSVLNDRRTGRSDRSADFHALAVWFAEAPDEEAIHRLWRAAFGLQSSRHLTVDADTLEARDAAPVAASVSWTAAPPIEISPRLRQTGHYERRGKPNRVIDRSEQRRFLAERAAREAAQTATARDALLAKVGQRAHLSDVGRLDPHAFRLFLGLLGAALAAKTPGRSEVEATTSDGSLTITLTEVDGAGTAEIRTDAGVFRGPDHLVHVIETRGRRPAAGETETREPAVEAAR
ncbi:TIGR02677 family protein [Tsukamurella sp. PLM1]|uniref:TIGR02677 family protein n=1 Tax=Tsukamurella sp. PLM1 TaxID=2929795 RepID=UPI0020C1870C|nr:TIGR02677 family protein [Tsukamurella sp. PLM1]